MPSLAAYSQVAIINKSTVVTDIDGANMVAALNALLPTFCSNWSIHQVNAVYISKAVKTIPTTAYQVFLLDNSDVSGALAYHDLTSSNIPYGKVFAKTVLLNGGVILYEPTLTKSTVAQTLSHEVFELLIDPGCNIWWMNYTTGLLFAGEVCDPVENNLVVVSISPTVKVGMSDWILPSWQHALNTIGPFNHLNTLSKPYQIKNGYAMIIQNNKITTIYGDSVTPLVKSYGQTGDRVVSRLNSVIKIS